MGIFPDIWDVKSPQPPMTEEGRRVAVFSVLGALYSERIPQREAAHLIEMGQHPNAADAYGEKMPDFFKSEQEIKAFNDVCEYRFRKIPLPQDSAVFMNVALESNKKESRRRLELIAQLAARPL